MFLLPAVWGEKGTVGLLVLHQGPKWRDFPSFDVSDVHKQQLRGGGGGVTWGNNPTSWETNGFDTPPSAYIAAQSNEPQEIWARGESCLNQLSSALLCDQAALPWTRPDRCCAQLPRSVSAAACGIVGAALNTEGPRLIQTASFIPPGPCCYDGNKQLSDVFPDLWALHFSPLYSFALALPPTGKHIVVYNLMLWNLLSDKKDIYGSQTPSALTPLNSKTNRCKIHTVLKILSPQLQILALKKKTVLLSHS